MAENEVTAEKAEEVASNCAAEVLEDACQGAKPKVFRKGEGSIRTDEVLAEKEGNLQKWKAAGIALRKALAQVEKRQSQLPSEARLSADNSPANSTFSGEFQSHSGESLSTPVFSNSSSNVDSYMSSCFNDMSTTNDMNSLLVENKDCDYSSLDASVNPSQIARKPLYKRTSASVPQGFQCTLYNGDSNVITSTADITLTPSNTSAVGAQGDLGLHDLHRDKISDATEKSPCTKKSKQHIGPQTASTSSSTFHVHHRTHCSKHGKHRNCHKSKLPVPIRRSSHPKTVKNKTLCGTDKIETKKSPSVNFVKTKAVVCRRKSKSSAADETKIPAPCAHISSSEDEFGPCDKVAVAVEKVPGLPSSLHLMTADSVANFADEELSSELSKGDTSDEEVKVLLEASLALGDRRPENPLCFLSSSEASLPSILSSSDDEVLAAAEGVLSSSSSPQPQQEDSIEAKADNNSDEEYDSLELESDDNFLFGDLPDIVSDESQAHEEEPQPIYLSSAEIDDALSDLKIETSAEEEKEEDAEEGTCEDADDEFECECTTCQYYNGLPDLMPRIGAGWGSDDENFFGEVDGYRFQPQQLSSNVTPLAMLLQQGRTSFLELMFQNVILQMLAVYPDLLGEQAPPPLSPQRLHALPTILISTLQADDECPCPICLCVFVLDEEAKELPCRHIFHALCIQAWLSKSGTCPVCRHQLQSSTED